MKTAFKIFLVITAMFSFLSTTAQEKLTAQEKTEFKAKVIAKAYDTESIVSDFIQEKHLSVFNDVSITNGKMVFLNPDRIRWEYTEPYKNIVIFKEGKLYTNANGQTNTLDLNTSKLFKDFNQLIVKGIKGDMFDEELFEIEYFKNAESFMVQFIPKEEQLKSFIEKFELKFDKHTAEILEVKMIEDTEDFTLIKFLNRVVNVEVDKKFFQF